ncbi:sulfatase family protein [Sunxiuqinia sp. A32]|uniref:sulfatase family protein n=1 Tax=Sunxiuqinia sp. A32 TaxID=3461496 RepID=UPI0040466B81
MKKNLIYPFAAISMAAGFSSCTQAEKQEKPNIIYIMSDDHGYQAISAYGHGMNQTPNIDRIASDGAIFLNAFVTNSLCAPSRAAMLTGKHSFVNGKLDNVSDFNWDQENFPKLLQQTGYQTALIGKIHLDGIPQGFDYSAVLKGQGQYYNPDFYFDGEKKQIHGYVTDITTKLTLDWLKNRDQDKPFCLLYHQKAPHRTWLPAPRHFKEYTKMSFKEPETLFDDYEGRGTAAKSAEMNILKHMNWAGDSKIYPEVMDELGIPKTWNNDKRALVENFKRMDEAQKAAWDSVYMPISEEFKNMYREMSEEDKMHWRYQRYMQDYLGCVAAVDEGVGKVLDYLEENGLDKNTIVVYTSDQGFYMGEHGWFDKRFMYEESFRTPLLVKYPNEIKPGTVIDGLVQNIDFAPTFLDYAGVQIPSNIQGESFRKLVSGESTEWRDAVYYTYFEYPAIHSVKRHYGVRTDRYKLIHFYYDIDEWELYDLEKDPHELKSIYDDPAYADVKSMMHKRLDEMREKYGDSDELDQQLLDRYLNARKK